MFPGTSPKFRERSCPSGQAFAPASDGHFFATMEPRKPKPAKRRRKRRVKEPMTEDLLNELLDSPDPAAFASKHKLVCRSLPDYLQQLLDDRGLRRPEVVRQAGINPTFGYQIFVGQRNPSRNKLLQLAFAMKLSLRETNRLLQAGGCNELYCKNRAAPSLSSASTMVKRCKPPMSSCTPSTRTPSPSSWRRQEASGLRSRSQHAGIGGPAHLLPSSSL